MVIATQPVRVSKTSTADAVVEAIRQMIENGDLKVGDDLPSERELAEQFGVSRTTLREASKRLEAYGVLDTRQKRGARIVNDSMSAILSILSFRVGVSEKTFRDVQRFRAVLETGFVPDIVGNARDGDIDNLRSINDRLKQPLAAIALADVDLEFHVRLLKIVNNNTALETYTALSGAIREIMTLGKAQSGGALAYQSHLQIIDALEKRDADELTKLLSEHMELGKRYLSQYQNTGENHRE